MKKKLFWIISILAVAILLCVAIDCFGLLPKKEQSKDADKTKILEMHSDALLENSSYIKQEKNGAKLNYKETVSYSDSVKLDVYTDSYNNEYTYNADGVLVNFKANDEDIALAQGKLAGRTDFEKDAVEIAKKYAKNLFGNRVDGFELKGIDYNEAQKTYSITFVEKHGEGGFIIGARCFVDVMTDGSVIGCTVSNEALAQKVGETKLNALTEQTLTDYVKAMVSKDYPDNTGYEIESVSLVEKDNKISLLVLVSVTEKSGENATHVGAEYYYDI